jgi:hypothetical protein
MVVNRHKQDGGNISGTDKNRLYLVAVGTVIAVILAVVLGFRSFGHQVNAGEIDREVRQATATAGSHPAVAPPPDQAPVAAGLPKGKGGR